MSDLDPIKDGAGFLWVRYDARDQDVVDALRERKQAEQDEHGLFTWGVPDGLARSVRELCLVLDEDCVPVIFSPSEGRSSRRDNGGEAELVWVDGADMHGDPAYLPRGLSVTSPAPRRTHSVLVCRTLHGQALDLETETGAVVPGMLTNLVTSAPVRPQVAAVAARHEGMVVGSQFRGALPITMRAELVAPHLVRYTESHDVVIGS